MPMLNRHLWANLQCEGFQRLPKVITGTKHVNFFSKKIWLDPKLLSRQCLFCLSNEHHKRNLLPSLVPWRQKSQRILFLDQKEMCAQAFPTLSRQFKNTFWFSFERIATFFSQTHIFCPFPNCDSLNEECIRISYYLTLQNIQDVTWNLWKVLHFIPIFHFCLTFGKTFKKTKTQLKLSCLSNQI